MSYDLCKTSKQVKMQDDMQKAKEELLSTVYCKAGGGKAEAMTGDKKLNI